MLFISEGTFESHGLSTFLRIKFLGIDISEFVESFLKGIPTLSTKSHKIFFSKESNGLIIFPFFLGIPDKPLTPACLDKFIKTVSALSLQ